MKCEVCMKEQAVQGLLCNTCYDKLENVPEEKLEDAILELMAKS